MRHLAALRGLDLTTLHGTGPGGRITRADVEHAQPPLAPRVRATPYARRLARDLGVDLAALRGAGTAEPFERRTCTRLCAHATGGTNRAGRPNVVGTTSSTPHIAVPTDSGAEQRKDTMRRARSPTS